MEYTVRKLISGKGRSRWTVRLAGSLLILLMSCGLSAAQKFPSRPITINLPFAAGGGVDLAVRKFADVVSRNVNQPVLIANRPGGGGIVAASSTLASPADGYTLYLATPATHASMQAMQTMPFDPLRDFKAVTMLFYFQNVLTLSEKIAPRTVEDLIKYGRAKPDGVVYGSPGHGSPAHILAAMFASAASLKSVHAPFRNGPEMNLSLVRGDIDFGFGTYQGMQAFWRAGQVKIIATVGTTRAKVFPDTPTFVEAGFPDLTLLSWYGLVAPVGTPDAVVQVLVEEFGKAAKTQDVQDFLEMSAFEGTPEGPAAFAALMAKDTARYAKIIPALELTNK